MIDLPVALAAGIAPLALVVGMSRGRGSAAGTPAATLDRATLALATGMAALTPLLVVAARAGQLHYAVVGGAGLVAAAVALAIRWKSLRIRASASDALVLALAVAFVVVAWKAGDVPWGAGRDQQVYGEFAELLARRATATVQLQEIDADDRAFLASLPNADSVRRFSGLTGSGGPDDPRLESYLPLGWPVWLGAWASVANPLRLPVANAMIFALGALVFFGLSRRIAGNALAVSATAALLLLPSSLWIASGVLSEPLAMAFVFAALAWFDVDEGHVRWPCAIALFGATLVRLDSLIVFIPLLLALLLAPGGAAEALTRRRRSAVSLLATLAAGCLWYALLHPAYFADKSAYAAQIGVAALALAFPLLAVPVDGWMQWRDTVAWRRVLPLSIVIALVAAFAYAAVFRPSVTPFSLIHNGGALDGTRDYREEALRNLAAYTGWPILVLALFQACRTWLRAGRGTAPVTEIAVAAMATVAAVLYLSFPHVSPDHPWALRRFVPMLIPGALLLAAMALRDVGRWGREGTTFAPLLLPALAAYALALHGIAQLMLRENAGVYPVLAKVAAALPPGLVIAGLDAGAPASVLLVAFGKPVVMVDLADPGTRGRVLAWAEARAARGAGAYVLGARSNAFPDLWQRTVEAWSIPREFVVPAFRAPARGVDASNTPLLLTRIDGPFHVRPDQRFGSLAMPDVEEGGFHPREVSVFGDLRQTNGAAYMILPPGLAAKGSSLTFEFVSWMPGGRERAVTLRLDGRTAWQGKVPPGLTTVRLPLERPDDAPLRIDFISETFDSRTVNPADLRGDIGIGLAGVRVERAPAASVPSSGPLGARFSGNGQAESMAMRPGASVPALASVTNSGTGRWRTARTAGDAPAVQFSVNWRTRGPEAPIVARQRVPIPFDVAPGETLDILLPLAAVDERGAPLPAGRYSVEVSVVRTSDPLPAPERDPRLRFDVTLAP